MFIALMLAGASSAFAQLGENRDTHKPEHHTLLWRIEGNGVAAPSYLFGTMHVLCESDARLSDGLKTAIRNSDTIYFEVDLDNIRQLFSALRHLQMKDGLKLTDLLKPEEYQQLETCLRQSRSPLPLTLLNRFKPFVLAALLGEQGFDCERKQGMEQAILKEAKSYRKPVKGLETIEFQASLFDRIPYEEQARALLQYVDSAAQLVQANRKMTDVYLSEDLDQLDALMLKSDPGMANYLDLLLYERNRRWAEKIHALIRDQSHLFAVGAGHLPGIQGVLQLLREKGYTLIPVKNW